ncbi:hypothetical protein PR048_029647 [Dryococelus australis]|uniref:Uncharacterized protein n=1 Tax=Dryococelus australis TaxID=614101 RepID=A0ABQ9GDZ5_9NEOP|nr:hypothetical protein PR048_029647 [Dryococelus australis]
MFYAIRIPFGFELRGTNNADSTRNFLRHWNKKSIVSAAVKGGRPVVGGSRVRVPAPPTRQIFSSLVALGTCQQDALTRASSISKCHDNCCGTGFVPEQIACALYTHTPCNAGSTLARRDGSKASPCHRRVFCDVNETEMSGSTNFLYRNNFYFRRFACATIVNKREHVTLKHVTDDESFGCVFSDDTEQKSNIRSSHCSENRLGELQPGKIAAGAPRHPSVILGRATQHGDHFERLACPPPTKANLVQTPAWRLPDFRMSESCRTMPLVGRFSRGYPVSPALSFWRFSVLTSITLIDSQDLAVKRSPNLFIHFTHKHACPYTRVTHTPFHIYATEKLC